MDPNAGQMNNFSPESVRTIRAARFSRSYSESKPNRGTNYPPPPESQLQTRSISPLNLLPVHETSERPRVEPGEEINNDLKRVYVRTKALITIVKTLLVALLVIRMVIVLLFICAIVTTSTEKPLIKILDECFSKGLTFCYSEITKIFFPFRRMIQTSRLSITIFSSGLSNSPVIFEFGLLLSVNNPFILLAAYLINELLVSIVVFIRRFLEKTAKVTAVTGNNQALRRVYTVNQAPSN